MSLGKTLIWDAECFDKINGTLHSVAWSPNFAPASQVYVGHYFFHILAKLIA